MCPTRILNQEKILRDSLLKPIFCTCCSTYEGQDLLDTLADVLCPTFFPPGQECTLPLNPGQYGSLVGGPLDITIPDIPDIIGKTQGFSILLPELGTVTFESVKALVLKGLSKAMDGGVKVVSIKSYLYNESPPRPRQFFH